MKILYICTHNRCRSVLSEAITNQLAGGLIQAKSAGSSPADAVHPLTLKFLKERGYETQNLTSKSWDDEVLKSFEPDVVITVCDQAAGESCPLWLGSSTRVHWGLSDPSKVSESDCGEQTDTQQREAFFAVIDQIEARVQLLKKVAAQNLSPEQLKAALSELTDSEGL